MRLFIDKDSNQFITDPGFKSPIGAGSIIFKRGDSADIELSFVKGNEVEPLADGALIKFGIKPQGEYEGDLLVFADESTPLENSYLISPNFNTVELNEVLNSGDGDPTNDVANVSVMLEVIWSEDGGTRWRKSRTLTVTVSNDVLKDEDGTPAALADPDAWMKAALDLQESPDDSSGLILNSENLTPAIPSEFSVYLVGTTRNRYSTDGNETPASSGIWAKLTYGAGQWSFEVYENGSAIGLWRAITAAIDPSEVVTWDLMVGSMTGSPNFTKAGPAQGQVGRGAIARIDDEDLYYVQVAPDGDPARWVRLAEWDKVVSLTGSQTVEGAKTFSGQMELTGQAATNATSAMTRELCDKEQLFNNSCVRDLLPLGHNTSGSGSSSIYTTGFTMTGGTSANAWQRTQISRDISSNPGASGGIQWANVPFAVALAGFAFIESTARSEIVVMMGDTGSGAPPAIGSNWLSGRGFGFRIFYGTDTGISLFTHDGTSYVESAPVLVNFDGSNLELLRNFILSTSGNGTIKLFYGNAIGNKLAPQRTSSTPLITLTGGPSGYNNYAGQFLSALIRNGPTAPSQQAQLRILNTKLHVGTEY